MAKTFKILSLLLSYPDEEIRQSAGALRDALRKEGMLPKQAQAFLEKHICELENRDLYDLQERYVLLFDRTRSLSLHLFEHIHGEGRDRGQAMLDLKAHYAGHGYDIAVSELPDFLPLFLEFLSTLHLEEARELLDQPLHIIAALRTRLQRRESAYAAVFAALETIASRKPAQSRLKELLGMEEDDPQDFEKIDEIWEDAPVTFGPGAAADGCNPNRIATVLRAARRPAPDGSLPGGTN